MMAPQRKTTQQQPVCRDLPEAAALAVQDCPPVICKRCYHRHIWPDRPEARAERASGGADESTPVELRYDGYSGTTIEVRRR